MLERRLDAKESERARLASRAEAERETARADQASLKDALRAAQQAAAKAAQAEALLRQRTEDLSEDLAVTRGRLAEQEQATRAAERRREQDLMLERERARDLAQKLEEARRVGDSRLRELESRTTEWVRVREELETQLMRAEARVRRLALTNTAPLNTRTGSAREVTVSNVKSTDALRASTSSSSSSSSSSAFVRPRSRPRPSSSSSTSAASSSSGTASAGPPTPRSASSREAKSRHARSSRDEDVVVVDDDEEGEDERWLLAGDLASVDEDEGDQGSLIGDGVAPFGGGSSSASTSPIVRLARLRAAARDRIRALQSALADRTAERDGLQSALARAEKEARILRSESEAAREAVHEAETARAQADARRTQAEDAAHSDRESFERALRDAEAARATALSAAERWETEAHELVAELERLQRLGADELEARVAAARQEDQTALELERARYARLAARVQEQEREADESAAALLALQRRLEAARRDASSALALAHQTPAATSASTSVPGSASPASLASLASPTPSSVALSSSLELLHRDNARLLREQQDLTERLRDAEASAEAREQQLQTLRSRAERLQARVEELERDRDEHVGVIEALASDRRRLRALLAERGGPDEGLDSPRRELVPGAERRRPEVGAGFPTGESRREEGEQQPVSPSRVGPRATESPTVWSARAGGPSPGSAVKSAGVAPRAGGSTRTGVTISASSSGSSITSPTFRRSLLGRP